MDNEFNDLKVVKFKNISTFEFTPTLGAMFDSRPVFGKDGKCIKEGEVLLLPYHVGRRLAINLAKLILVKESPIEERGKGDPSVSGALFGDENIKVLVEKIITDAYQEDKPIEESETDILMSKVEELNKVNSALEGKSVSLEGYKDKAEIIAELEKRGISHDKRMSKDKLEALL